MTYLIFLTASNFEYRLQAGEVIPPLIKLENKSMLANNELWIIITNVCIDVQSLGMVLVLQPDVFEGK